MYPYKKKKDCKMTLVKYEVPHNRLVDCSLLAYGFANCLLAIKVMFIAIGRRLIGSNISCFYKNCPTKV